MVRFRRSLIPAFFGLALLIGVPWQALAQPGGSRGGSSGRSGPSGARPSFAPARSGAPSINSAYRGPAGAWNSYNSYYHNGNNYRRYPYLYPYFYPFALGNYDYSYAPFAFGYAVPGSFLYDTNPPQDYPIDGPPGPPPGPQSDAQAGQEAVIEVVLPTEDAQVWLDGNKTTSTGTRRTYMTPPLGAGSFTYRVTVSWRQDGQDVRAERTISLVPGRTVLADFSKVNSQPRTPEDK